MIRRAAFLMGAVLAALFAMEHSPPPDWPVQPSPSPEPEPVRATARIRWPIAYPQPRQPGATWGPLWRPYIVVPEAGR